MQANSLRPHIRILGAARAGKTTLTEALQRLDPVLVSFGSTPKYVYAWLRAAGIGDVGEVTLDQVDTREQIFKQLNEHEATIISDILTVHPKNIVDDEGQKT